MKMDMQAIRELIKNNPVFWSRLGFCYDPPLKNEQGRPLVFNEDLDSFAATHRAFFKAGVKIHSSILHSGWVGVDEYDYSLTDRVLDAVFYDNPEIYYIPRIKLNVPIDWTAENPEEVFVYYGGPQTAEEIRTLVGTEKQDYLGYESEIGYRHAGNGGFHDTRPNVGGMIARQSFSSKKWLHDAGVALGKVIDRIESGKYADRILAYHIGYGASGETVVWGRASNRYGDYGICNTREFIRWGEKKYGSYKKLAKAWKQDINGLTVPPPDLRAGKTETLGELMRADMKDKACIDYDIFTSEVNADAAEYFARIAKEHAKDKLVGIFYGYFMHVDNSAYTGHLAIERLLNSPYVDFFAAPKSYYRCRGGEPGGELCAAQSVNLKKMWIDETDVRTYLAQEENADWQSKTLQDTINILRREFCKNLAHDSSFWWMDLDGGWYDSDILMDEIEQLVKINDRIRTVSHRSISDILIVVDENCINHMRVNGHLRKGFMEDFICEANMTGALVDVFRMTDLEELNLSQYKLIIFAYTFSVDRKTRSMIRKIIPKGATVMYNYAAGILGEDFHLENVRDFTGFTVYETAETGCESNLPRLAVEVDDEMVVLEENDNKETVLAMRCAVDGVRIINLIPYMKSDRIRELAQKAGCAFYTDISGSTVYGDNRFIGIFSRDGKSGSIHVKI